MRKKRLLIFIWGFCFIGTSVRGHSMPSGLWLDVPFVKQEKNLCGAACISMVMQYWAKSQEAVGISEAAKPVNLPDIHEIGQALYSQEAKGIFGRDMERYFKGRDFQTFIFKGEWTDLADHLVKGRPLIVLLKGNGKGSPFHYVVITGLNQWQDFVLVNDPSQRKLLKLNRPSFEKAWNLAASWTLLVLPQPLSTKAVNSSHAE